MLARSFGIALVFNERVALFLTAWFIYLVDRVADSFTVPPTAPLSLRQQFYRKYRVAMIALAVTLALADTITALTLRGSTTFQRGGIIAGAIVLYLAINHFAPRLWRWLPLKELAIGFLFALGTASALSFRQPAVYFFGALCAVNCLTISALEMELDDAQGRQTFFTAWPRTIRLPLVLSWIITFAAVVNIPSGGDVAWCIALSAIFLGWLNRVPLDGDASVAFCDLALLTPIPFLLW